MKIHTLALLVVCATASVLLTGCGLEDFQHSRVEPADAPDFPMFLPQTDMEADRDHYAEEEPPLPHYDAQEYRHPHDVPEPEPDDAWTSMPRFHSSHSSALQSAVSGENAILRLTKQMPEEVQLNDPFEYTITVSNETNATAGDVVVSEHLADHFRAIKSSPKATLDQGYIIWRLGSIPGRATKTITVRGVATQPGPILQCATMSYMTETCSRTNVVEPALALAMSLPTQVGPCDTIPMKLIVSNPGTGSARDAVIRTTLPPGIRTEAGEKQLILNAGTLGPGQSREFTAQLKASRAGTYETRATATAAGGLMVESLPRYTTVRQAALSLKKTGPGPRYLGRPATYTIKVTNHGDMTARNILLEDTIPVGMRFIRTNYDGVPERDRINWMLPALPPNESHWVEVTYQADQEGTFTSQTTTSADCVSPASISSSFTVKGIPALMLEVVDVEDPIQLGDHETYVITTTNQGTSDATNITIVCQLEDNVEYHSSLGPTTGVAQGNTVIFKPLDRLPPLTKATWHVVIKAIHPGDVRFKVSMNSDQLSRPVEESESTQLYE